MEPANHFIEDIAFWKKIFYLLSFFLITPFTLIFTILIFHNNPQSQAKTLSAQDSLYPSGSLSGTRVYASLPSDFPEISLNIVSEDARVEIISQYLSKYDSPLVPYAEKIVNTSDKYNLDFRLTTAIAQQESNLCKKAPPDTYNCWGWGIHSRGTLGFSGFEDGIETVSYGLRNNYLNEGYQSLTEIMSKYTPMSPGTWSAGVEAFMLDMR